VLSHVNILSHILLVEDNPLDVELTLDAFREAQLDSMVHVVRNGHEALNYLFGRNQYGDRETHPLPNLILLDLHLPGIDGHEVLQEIKATPQLKRLPVIILTSSKEEKDVMRSYDKGANSYLVKPVSVNGFLDVVNLINHYWLTLNIRPPLSGYGES
jgi:two-component system response regulator